MWPRKQGCSHNGLRVLHISLFCIEPYSKLDSQSYGFSSSYVWVWEVDHKEGWGLKNWCFWTVVLEKTIQSPLNYKIKPANLKGNQPWIFIGRTYAEAEAPILWPPDVKNQFIRKDPDAEKDWRQEKKGTSEDEVARWHHQLNGHESEQAPRDSVGQDRQVCCSSWGCKELNTTEQLNWTEWGQQGKVHLLHLPLNRDQDIKYHEMKYFINIWKQKSRNLSLENMLLRM